MINKKIFQNFEIIELTNEHVQILMIPELGSKICSIKNNKTGREWMWEPPDGPKYFKNNTGDPFPKGTITGADECFPTIEACQWRNLELTDHGEAWAEPWQLNEAALAQDKVMTSIDFPRSPLRLERTLWLRENTIVLEYGLTNDSQSPFEYLWALHPMMAIEDGDQLVLPEECKSLRLSSTIINSRLGKYGDIVDYPIPSGKNNLAELRFAEKNAAIKFFTEKLTLGCAALRNTQSGEYIVFSQNVKMLNTYGIWINRGGWGAYQHVAIEPTNGAPDALDVAVKDWKRYSSISPNETLSWDINISLGVDKLSEGDAFLEKFILK